MTPGIQNGKQCREKGVNDMYESRVPIAATLLIVLGTPIVLATIPGPDAIISGCFSKDGGSLRVIDTALDTCTANESLLTWNQAGPAGLSGSQGPQGIAGPTGAAGLRGPSGPGGAAGAVGAAGTAGSVGSGGHAYFSFITNFGGLENQGKDVLSLNVPAGSYVVKASLSMIDTVGSDQNATCSLSTGDQNQVFLSSSDALSRLPMSLQDIANFGSPGTVTLHCQGFGVVINRANLAMITAPAIN
jgi:hypothetical protein